MRVPIMPSTDGTSSARLTIRITHRDFTTALPNLITLSISSPAPADLSVIL